MTKLDETKYCLFRLCLLCTIVFSIFIFLGYFGIGNTTMWLTIALPNGLGIIVCMLVDAILEYKA